MKKLYLKSALLLLSFGLNAQNYKITYGKLAISTQEELNAIKDLSVRNNIIEMNKSFEELEYVLLVNKNLAKFSYFNKLQTTSFNKRIISFGGGGNKIYYEIDDKIVITETELSNKLYFIKESLNKYDWKISNDTKLINDFLCYKAIANISYDDFRGKENYNIVAWFCPEFPFPYGPDQYFGLPGLVFEAYQENSKIKFYLKKIEKEELSISINFPNEKTHTEEEFTEIFNKIMADLIDGQ